MLYKKCKQVRWICLSALALLAIFDSTIAELKIISRARWGGEDAKGAIDKLQLPVRRVVICHTASGDCADEEACAQRMRNIQNFHMKQAGFDDIAYNFLIGNDGNVYEGRGWDHLGAYARGYNTASLGVSFIGTYEKSLPSEAALQAASSLLSSAVENGKITADYKLFGHRQIAMTSSPGNMLYAALKQWPHWSASITD